MSASLEKRTVTVVKIGGHVIDDQAALSRFLQAFAALQGPCVLVHGGGKMATQLAEQMGIPQQMIGGRRVTDEATLKIVTMVYAGYINKQLVAGLQAAGCNALGLCGADGNLVQAHKRRGAGYDYGFAGDVDAVNASLISRLLHDGLSLVVAPITHNREGQLLNTNADTMAREIALAMSGQYTVRLVYCFEKEGVLRDVADKSSLIGVLHKYEIAALIEDGVISGGMVPKIHNAFAALDQGVQEIIIGNADRLPLLVQGLSGTKMTHD